MAEEAEGFVRSCAPEEPIDVEFRAYMRYKGQGWEIPVEVTADMAASPDATTFQTAFESAYAALFSRTVEGLAIEIAIWTAKATTRPAQPDKVKVQGMTEAAKTIADRRIFDPALGDYAEGAEVDRAALASATGVQGPAAVTERETTLIVPASREVVGQDDGTLRMTVKGDAS